MQGKSIEQLQNELVEDFVLFDNWDDKYEYIIELGKNLPVLETNYKTDENKIKGCQSNVWLVTEMKGNLIYFKADSDSVIVKGLAAILINVLSSQTPEAIINANMDFMGKIGLMQHLAMTRSNGLLAMLKQMKYYAVAMNNMK